jgi:RNA polymerase sigma-70 factor (ECF subfamily)
VTSAEEIRAAELMRGAQAGDELVYAELLVLLTAATERYVRRKYGCVSWVDDVVQETLWTVHRVRHTYDPRRPFAPWFYAIAATRLVDVWRREHRVAKREVGGDAIPDTAGPAPEAADERSHLDVERIRTALRSLPAGQRLVVQALKYRGESVRAASVRLGMTEASVKITAHRGYNALRRLLGGSHRAN